MNSCRLRKRPLLNWSSCLVSRSTALTIAQMVSYSPWGACFEIIPHLSTMLMYAVNEMLNTSGSPGEFCVTQLGRVRVSVKSVWHEEGWSRGLDRGGRGGPDEGWVGDVVWCRAMHLVVRVESAQVIKRAIQEAVVLPEHVLDLVNLVVHTCKARA